MASNTLTSSLIVRVLDQASAPARSIAKSLLGISDAANKAGRGSFGDRLNSAVEANNRALDRVRGQMVDTIGTIYAFKAALAAPIDTAVKFESAMADIGKVSGFDDKGLEAYGKRLRKLAVTEIPLAVNDLAALSAAAAQAGVPDADLFDFTRLTAKAAVAWDMSGAEAGDALAKIRTALGLTNDQTSKFADAVNYVSDQTAASSRDMIDFTKRVASQGEFFGFSKEQTLAFGAAMISAGAESEVAATSFRNMGKALTRGASASKSQLKAYHVLGLNSKKVAKEMQKDAVGTTLKVIQKIGEIPKHMQAAVMSDLFGDEARALAPLLNNTELLRKALSMTAQEQTYLNSVGKEFEKRAATSAYKIQRFKSQLADIGLTIGGALLPALNQILQPLDEMALKFSDWAEAHPELIRQIILATGAVIGFRAALVGLKWAGLIGRGSVLSALALGFNTLGVAIIGAARAAKNATGLQAALAAMDGAKYGGIARTVDALKAMALAVPGVTAIGGALSAVGSALASVSVPAWGLIALGVAAVAASGAAIWRYWDRISAVFDGVARAVGERLQPVFEALRPVTEAVAKVADTIGSSWDAAKGKLTAFFDWFGSLFQREILGEGDKQRISQNAYDMTNRILAAFGALPGQMLAIGSQIIQGLWDGMVAKWNDFYAWISSRAEAIRSAFSINPFSAGYGPGVSVPVDGARAAGGPVSGGGTYLVGENGPELFRPRGSGSIVPNGETMAALRNSAAASGSGSRPAAGGGISVSVSGIAINGVQDIRGAAREIAAMIEDEIRQRMQAVHADVGV